jgi:hypothetical protein
MRKGEFDRVSREAALAKMYEVAIVAAVLASEENGFPDGVTTYEAFRDRICRRAKVPPEAIQILGESEPPSDDAHWSIRRGSDDGLTIGGWIEPGEYRTIFVRSDGTIDAERTKTIDSF